MQESEGKLNQETIFQCSDIVKSFGPTKALSGVSLSVAAGEIHGLIGENGSGKSTLCNIIAGALRGDAGEMMLFGEPYNPQSTIEAKNAGICMLQQESGTIDGLTVAENMFVGKETSFSKGILVNRKTMNKRAREILSEIGMEFRVEDPVESYNFEERKLIEIASALYYKPKLLIVDETTTAITQKGRDLMYALLKQLKKDGASVIFITHDMAELMEVCDIITVLRDGCLIDTVDKASVTEDDIRQKMIGRDLAGHYYREDYGKEISGEVVLDVQHVTVGKMLRDVSFQLHKGEILGIGGLTDCGMHVLGKAIFGALPVDIGAIQIEKGKVSIKSTTDALAVSVGYIPKNRDTESIFLDASIKENISIASYPQISRRGFLNKRSERALAQQQVETLSVKMQSVEQLCRDLSGGNKQKVANPKWNANDSEILVMDCPTRGIDIGVKATIYELIEKFKDQGKSVILISEELPELIGMSDRLLIMKNGKINGEFHRGRDLSENRIIQKML